MSQNTPHQPPDTRNGHHNGTSAEVPRIILASPHDAASSRPVDPVNLLTGTAPDAALGSPSVTVRQAAQPHAHEPADLGVAGENDPLPPPLDKDGLPKQRPIVFISPVPPSANPVKDTARQRVIQKLEEHFPLRAPELEADLDEGVQAQRERHLDLERREWEQLTHSNAEIERRNLAIEARRAELERERDAASADDRERLQKVHEELQAANQQAATAVPRAHGVFDASRVEINAIRDSMRWSVMALAGRLGLPFAPDDEHWGENAEKWTDPASGALFGTSLGVMIGVVELSSLKSLRIGAFVMWAVMMLVGLAVAVESGRALEGGAARLQAARRLKAPASEWLPILAVLMFKTVVIVSAWTWVDAHGLMKVLNMAAANMGRGPVSPLVGLAAGTAISVSFAAFALERGTKRSNWSTVKTLLEAAQEDDLRTRTEVSEALDAVGQVIESQRQQSSLLERIAQIEAPFNAETARLASFVREPRLGLDESAHQRLRQSHDCWAASFGSWKGSLEQLLDEAEPLKGPASPFRGQQQGEQETTRRPVPRQGWFARLGKKVRGWFGR